MAYIFIFKNVETINDRKIIVLQTIFSLVDLNLIDF